MLPKGQIAPARPLTLPLIPAIMTADLTKDGVWNHGDVISTSDVTKPLPLKATDQVASTLDSKGNWDVAFTESRYVVVEAPLDLSVPKALFGACTVYDAFRWKPGAQT